MSHLNDEISYKMILIYIFKDKRMNVNKYSSFGFCLENVLCTDSLIAFLQFLFYSINSFDSVGR